MNLVIFDIDGTIVDSVKTDDDCYIQSLRDLFEIDLTGADWNDFQNVTDIGLIIEVFLKHFGRQPLESEILNFKKHFYRLLHERKSEIDEIKGASSTLQYLSQQPDICLAFATGGWRETAELKLSTISFDSSQHILTSANDHMERAGITKFAIEKSLNREDVSDFDSVTYVGDGLWDLNTTIDLCINFIGIDFYRNNRLQDAGALRVIPDMVDGDQILRWVRDN